MIEQWFTGQLDPERSWTALLDGLRRVRDAVHPGATAGSTDASPSTPTDGTRRSTALLTRRRARRHRQKDRQNCCSQRDDTGVKPDVSAVRSGG